MKDKFGREVDYMRISITEKCNYRCFYCIPENYQNNEDVRELLSKNEIIQIVKIGVESGVKKVRITGGEPLIRKDIDKILKGISDIDGVEELCLTTNGSLLYEKVDTLKKLGVNRINVSLDTLDENKFKEITRCGDLKSVLRGIDKAVGVGIQVRINSVIVSGINDDEIIDLVGLTKKYPVDLRFIELMPIGEGKRYKGVKGVEIKDKIFSKENLIELYKREGVSEYYKIKGAKGRVGFIDPLSNCFCGECNRIRVTSKGILKQCLNKRSSLNIGEIIRGGATNKDVVEIIKKEIYNKPEKHVFNSPDSSEENADMNQIGG